MFTGIQQTVNEKKEIQMVNLRLYTKAVRCKGRKRKFTKIIEQKQNIK